MEFYYTEFSAPCRAVMLTAKALGVRLIKKPVDLMAGEHKQPEYRKKNPMSTVPMIVDGKFTLWESRAIQTFLVNRYATDDKLYPRNVQKRALVDAVLYFDAGTLSPRMGNFIGPVVFGGQKPDPEKRDKLLEAVGLLNVLLEGKLFVTGDEITVADHALIATISTLIEDDVVDVNKFPNVANWVKRSENEMIGYQQENANGAKMHGEFVGPKLRI